LSSGAISADAAIVAAEPQHAKRRLAADRTIEPGTFATHLSKSGESHLCMNQLVNCDIDF
jgi:hypothetical protein